MVSEDVGAIDALLRPRGVAIVGASTKNPPIRRLLDHLAIYPFAGELALVNPRLAGTDGYFGSLREVPHPVDLAVIALRADLAPGVIAECGERRVRAAVVLASDFAEVGESGAERQRVLAEAARRHGVRLLGPNCNGCMSFLDSAVFTTASGLAELPPIRGGPTAFIAQSGGVLVSILQRCGARDLPVGICISTGNEADLKSVDLIEALLEDERIRVVGAYLEQVRDPARLLAAADRARGLARRIVVLRGGQSVAGARAAATHTGALSGDWRVMGEVLAGHGVTLVETLEELLEVSYCLAVSPPRRGPVVFVSSSGGGKVLLADAAEAAGLPLAPLSEPLQAELRDLLPPFSAVENPLDTTQRLIDDPASCARAVRAIADDPGVGAVVVQPPASTPLAVAQCRALLGVAPSVKVPLTVLWPAGPVDPDLRAALLEAGIWLSLDSRCCVAAVKALAEPAPGPANLIDEAVWQQVEGAWRKHRGPLGPGVVGEHEAKLLLADLGLSVPPRAFARGAEEAVAAAGGVGFPLYLKVAAPGVTHKARLGGVRYVAGPGSVAEEYRQMERSVGEGAPGVAIEGAVLERAVRPLAELLVGITRHETLGPLVLVGAGGTLSEELHDVAVGEPALDEESATRLLLATDLGRAVHRALGRTVPQRCWDALLEAVRRVSCLAAIAPEIAELDVNPLALVDAEEGAVALDGVIVVMGGIAER